jgi:hypothetical protein
MSWWIGAAAFIVLYVAITKQFEGIEERANELDELKRELEEKQFWGFSTRAEEREAKEKLAEKTSEREGWKKTFGWLKWYLFGGLLVAFWGVIWFGEDESHTWVAFSDIVSWRALFGITVVVIYKVVKRFEGLERKIAFINQRLKAVKEHAESMRKASIDEYLQMRDRLKNREDGN